MIFILRSIKVNNAMKLLMRVFIIIEVAGVLNGTFGYNTALINDTTSLQKVAEDRSGRMKEIIVPFELNIFQNYLNNHLLADANCSFNRSFYKENIKYGGFVVKFDQYYNKYIIENAQVFVMAKNDGKYYLIDHSINVGIPNINKTVSREDAYDIAIKYVLSLAPTSDSAFSSASILKDKDSLVILKDNKGAEPNYFLAHRVNVKTNSDEYVVFISAVDGNIIKRSQSKRFLSPGEADTKYDGVKAISTYYSGGQYYLECHTRGVCRIIQCEDPCVYYGEWGERDCEGDPIFIPYDADNAWDTYKDATQALYSYEKASDYYYNTFDRIGYDNDSGDLRIIYDYALDSTWPVDDNNQMLSSAFTWPTRKYIQCGFGGVRDDNDTTTDWVAVDVIGHEYAHLVSASTVGFQYDDESGATDEAYSDIFGTLIEYYAIPGSANYKMFSQVYTDPSHCLRDLTNPKNKLDPSTYGGNYWFPRCIGTYYDGECHKNSNIPSHWFYLLSEGGSGTNDHGVSYSITGIGKNNVGEILYYALENFLGSYCTFSDLRDYTWDAAYYLGWAQQYGQKIYDAWDAVGVYNNCTMNEDNITISNDTISTEESYIAAAYFDGKKSITVSNTTVSNSGGSLDLYATNTITLSPGFWAKSGSSFNARIYDVDIPPSPKRHIQINGKSTEQYESQSFYCFPNPFNSSIRIYYSFNAGLQNGSKINNANIYIISITGKYVNMIYDGTISDGKHFIDWNGKMKNGELCASGVYLCLIKIDGTVRFVKKITYLR
jgi:Zn-dependent metalloprotease